MQSLSLKIISLLLCATKASQRSERNRSDDKHSNGTSFGDLLVKLEPYRYNSDRGYGIQNNFNEVRNFEDLQWMVCFKIDGKIYSPHEERLTDNAGILEACRYWFPADNSEEMIRKRIFDECQLSPTCSDGSSMTCSPVYNTMPIVPNIRLPEAKIDHQMQQGLYNAATRSLIQEIKQKDAEKFAETRGNESPSESGTPYWKRLRVGTTIPQSSPSVPVRNNDFPSPCSNDLRPSRSSRSTPPSPLSTSGSGSRSASSFTFPTAHSPSDLEDEANRLSPPADFNEDDLVMTPSVHSTNGNEPMSRSTSPFTIPTDHSHATPSDLEEEANKLSPPTDLSELLDFETPSAHTAKEPRSRISSPFVYDAASISSDLPLTLWELNNLPPPVDLSADGLGDMIHMSRPVTPSSVRTHHESETPVSLNSCYGCSDNDVAIPNPPSPPAETVDEQNISSPVNDSMNFPMNDSAFEEDDSEGAKSLPCSPICWKKMATLRSNGLHD